MKRCQVCGEQFDPEADWNCAKAIRGRHIPTDRPGVVYILHFDEPSYVAQADNGHVQPTTHYVGWTSQPVERRVEQHGVPRSSVAHTQSGTAEDEAVIKQTENCPQCGVALAPECLGARIHRTS